MMILIKTLLLKNIIKNNKDTVYDSIGINIIATQHNVDNNNDTKKQNIGYHFSIISTIFLNNDNSNPETQQRSTSDDNRFLTSAERGNRLF